MLKLKPLSIPLLPAVLLLIILAAGLYLWRAGVPYEKKLTTLIQRAVEREKPAPTAYYAQLYTAKAGLAAACFAVVGLVALPWLSRPLPRRLVAMEKPIISPGHRRTLLLATALAILWSACMNLPRLHQSLWGDEEATVRRCVVGEFLPAESGLPALRYEEASWTDSAYYYREPNNHPLFSLAAKVSHTLLGEGPGQPQGYFREWVIRLPAYLAGLFGLAMLAWLAWELGQPIPGAIAVLLLALHPYFVRYGVDARGYALLFLLLPLMALLLCKSLRSGRWGTWIGWGLSQCLVLWAYPGALYALVAVNLAALVGIAALYWQRGAMGDWIGQMQRWAFASALGGVATLLALLPCVAPMRLYLQRARIRGSLTTDWLMDVGSYLSTGASWHPWGDMANPLMIFRQETFAAHPVIGTAYILAVLACLLAGIWHLWQARGIARPMLIAFLLPIPLLILATSLAGNMLYHWYVLIGFPGLLLTLACGLWHLASRLRKLPPAVVIVPAIAAFAAITWPVAANLRQHSVEPNLESVADIRPQRHPRSPAIAEVRTLGFIMHTRGYDPAAIMVKNVAELEEQLRQADAKQIPAYVHYGHPQFAQTQFPEIVQYLQTSPHFYPAKIYWGQDEPCTRVVFSYKSGSLRQ